MIVVDTSVWIEFLKKQSPIFSKLRELLEHGNVIAAEPVFGELIQGARNARERNIITDYWNHLPKFSMDGVFFRAGELASRHKWLDRGVGLIDAAILTYARERECKFWTLDRKLLSILAEEDRFRP